MRQKEQAERSVICDGARDKCLYLYFLCHLPGDPGRVMEVTNRFNMWSVATRCCSFFLRTLTERQGRKEEPDLITGLMCQNIQFGEI